MNTSTPAQPHAGPAPLPDDLDPVTSTGEEMRGFYRAVHEHGCPVVHSTALGGFWTLSSHAQIRAAATDWETFSSAAGVLLPKSQTRNVPIDYDPPEHTYWRKVFREFVSVGTAREAEELVRADTRALVDGFAGRGQAELVGELAAIVPGNAICRILGITDPERVRLGCASGMRMALATVEPDGGRAAVGAFAEFCFAEIGARRAAPRDDVLTRLGTEEFDGHRLTDDELIGMLIGFFFAGHHTTTGSLAALFQRISVDPQLRDALVADPALIPRAGEEAMRLDPPIHSFQRKTTRATDVDGTEIPADEEVRLSFAAGNLDPTVFPEPEEFRLDRKPNPHLTFGHGIHTCVGAALARMELRAVTEELLARLPDITATGGPVERTWVAGGVMTIAAVPVTFTPPSVR